MLPKYAIYEKLLHAQVVAVIRGQNSQEALEVSKAAISGGISAIELTYTTPEVEDVFKELRHQDILLGAGSVMDTETARHAILSGASFIVSSHFVKEIASLCNQYSVPYLPGCMSVSDMALALEAGCDVVKLFPANSFDPSFIKSVSGPLPNVRIMPTGGISLNSMNDWLSAGAVAVGVGSDLTKAYQKGGYEAAVSLSKEYVCRKNEYTGV
ncbi:MULTISPECIES: bifunctional 2-keto-4-hydroxyglutarate aldolase/2-keto-3-deoxy-6-phosphogluconate aldolase [Bacillus amyloliquefaciens group]|uniref:bifunctional 2-keto-4-hydroxyglutarate aldolase/2-keto-3-deoxy-6-phosphogluconate aldolase n=1 Tax=Bacillus amyloliquefaciens group TaxID=1938374 RepID=UPI0012EAB002|nr:MULTISPECIES: bifunctional 2-keto-4-hydroxyglutarate aldolase/2-keto-3-deoxy-6-phosphogluconate aldolase [Bacillus amyloliquefaciens group]MCR4367183.1 bifunctional 2-keto-4-hydroxyglutarate aldolase/2-keto-3-deoxy-6-phosphogluconate aldolase [Bacillus amyloliquefaciens]MCV3201298.1 bifunctional 2-keto-4-hydroxyglutarate aldolase/2-keto-3-deoxy-6-phosphogluconate aldolase [Bacillus velezensis]MDP1501126.1 bifunctional 2-keto-4-hydroxyglutarate aldolase/2-keto-3-deoxy-6-phosphogluconate aldola